MTTSVNSPILQRASKTRRKAGQKSPLMRAGWSYLGPTRLDDMTPGDWRMLDRQRAPYFAEECPKQALQMLAVQADAPSFGYQINSYEHCLQAATLALKDGLDEEAIVVSLFHDLGFVTNNESHGEFAAAFLRPYISEKHHWMLERHMYFQAVHSAAHPDVDANIRDRWRGHPHFDYTAEWVARYDAPSTDPAFENAPLETFVPMVFRIFSNPAPDLSLPD